MSIFDGARKYTTLGILVGMLHGCAEKTEIHDIANQKRAEVIQSVNHLLDKQNISYTGTPSCILELLQVRTNITDTIVTILQCGEHPTWSHRTDKIPRSGKEEENFVIEMRIPNIKTTPKGTLDIHSGCLQTFIHTETSGSRSLDTCKKEGPISPGKRYITM